LAVRIAGEDPDVLAVAALACRDIILPRVVDRLAHDVLAAAALAGRDEADLLVRVEQRRRANRRTRTRDR